MKELNELLQNIRLQYDKHISSGNELLADPILQFEKWMAEALLGGVPEPNAMDLCTLSDRRPSCRIVLLKGVNKAGFVFYTNYNSRKAKDIEQNNAVCLNFFWQQVARQVRIEGTASKVSAADSDEYFAGRPRASQLGAWASEQSEEISDRTILERKLLEIENKYQHQSVPRPPHWGGFVVIPTLFEFWQGRPDRLHDRFRYLKDNSEWIISRLSP